MESDIGRGVENERVELYHDGSVHIGATVIQAVSQAIGLPIEELDIELNDVVDPDALNHLFADRLDGTPRTGGSVEFVMGECRVTVDSDGWVHARRL